MIDQLRISLRGIFVENATLKLVAFLLMLVVYLWVRGDREVNEAMYARIRLQPPTDYVLTSAQVDRVKLNVRGRYSALSRFNEDEIKTLELDLSTNDDGRTLILSPDLFALPPGLRVTSVQPSRVQVDLAKKIVKRVPIRPKLLGEPPGSYKLGAVLVEPSTMEISGPAHVLKNTTFLRTQGVDVAGKTSSFEQQVRLNLDDARIEFDLEKPVKVSVEIDVKEVERTLEDIPVVAVNTSMLTRIKPQTTSVLLRGPQDAVERLVPKDIFAAVDLSDLDKPGSFQKSVEIQNLPPEVKLQRVYPSEFQVVTRKRAAPLGP